MRTMTDKEFQRLKDLLHALRSLYREQTGRNYVLGVDLPEMKTSERVKHGVEGTNAL